MIAIALSLMLAAGPGEKAEPSPADIAKAKELFGAGQKFYKQGEYPDAIAKFEEANVIRPHPVIIFNIAKCYEQMGETAKSMRAYRDYLRLSPDAKDKESVSDSIANLGRRLKDKGVQQLMVFADPPNARIEVDGKHLGISPASIELTAGAHKVVVRAQGFETNERTYTMSISQAQELTIPPLKAGATPPIPQAGDVPKKDPAKNDDPKVATLTPATTTTPATATGTTGSTTSAVAGTTAPAPAKKGRVVTWIVGGFAVASAGAGVGLGFASAGAANEMRAAQHTQAQAQQLHDQAAGLSTGANIAYGVAAAAAIAAVVLFFVEK